MVNHSPGNKFGFGSKQFYDYEAKYRGFKSPQEWLKHEKKIAPKCPVCNTPKGFNFGTGDCDCEN